MNKKLIRLTESDLHRIVKESVNMILNEVQFGGKSLHGDNPDDWNAVANEREKRANRVDPTLGRRGGSHKDLSPQEFRAFAKNKEGNERDRGHFYATQDEKHKDSFSDLANLHYKRAKDWQNYRNKGNN